MNLRTIGMTAVAALALVAGRAQAQEVAPAAAPAAGGGWDTKGGLIFTLPNPFGGGSGRDVFDQYAGKIGYQMNLAPQNAIRLGVGLKRASCGRTEVTENGLTYKRVCTLGTETVSGIALPYNSDIGVNLSAEYLLRMSTSDVSPYFGVGAYIDYDRKAKTGKDENFDGAGYNAGYSTEYKDSLSKIGFGLIGKAGLEWRVNKVIALFAEYQLDLSIFQRTSGKFEETDSVPGFPSTVTKAESKQSTFLNWQTDRANTGLLGIAAFF